MSIASTYPIKLTYNNGQNVGTINDLYISSDGFNYALSPLLSGVKDATFSQNSLNILTNNFSLADSLSSKDYPYDVNFTLSSTLDIGGNYLQALDSGHIGFTTDYTQATVWGLNFDTTNNIVFISYSNNNICKDSTGTLLLSSSPRQLQNQSFYYSLYEKVMSLFTRDQGLIVYNNSGTLSIGNFSSFDRNFNIINIDRFSYAEYGEVGTSSNVKYVKTPNSIKVDEATNPLNFNYLITTPYVTVDPVQNTLDYSITLLKNYYSPEYIQTPALSARSRLYNKLHTGLNTEAGSEKIYLSYLGNEVVESFKKDIDTYFHYPVSAVNVPLSGSTLAKSGAQPGSSPWRSDRIFVKKADYRKYSPWGNYNGNQTGVFFCSWLSASDIGSEPVWMDRYFAPSAVDLTQVLTSTGAGPSNNNYPNLIWDVPSTQVFSPESLYVYHKIGDNDNMLVVDTLSGSLTHYVENWTSPLIDAANGLTTGDVYSLSSNSVQTFPGTRDPALNTAVSYATLSLTNDDFYTPGFTIAFQAYSTNWLNIQGEQILGNYYNGGIGLFKNNPLLTPFVTIIGDKIRTFNTNLVSLSSNTPNAPAIQAGNSYIVKSNYDESYFIIDGNRIVHEYDQDGALVSEFNAVQDSGVSNATVIGANLILEGGVRKLLIFFKVGTTIDWRKYLTTGILDPNTTNSGSQNNVSTYYVDLNNQINYYINTHDGKGTGTVVDSNNVVWALDGDTIVRGINTSTVNAVLSARQAESIVCDHLDNIWVLYSGNNLSKLDNYGRVVWDVNLPGNQLFGATRTLNFVAELNGGSTNYYGLLLDGKNQILYKINPVDGSVVTSNVLTTTTYYTLSTTALLLQTLGDATGYDYQRKYYYYADSNPSDLIVKALVENVSTLNADRKVSTLDFNASTLTPGWHHFAITVDPYNKLNLYVDGDLVASTSIGNLSNGIYRVYNSRNNPNLVIGTTSFKNQTLSQFTNQTTDPYSFNGYIADVRFYNQALQRADIVAVQKRFLLNSFSDLTWAAPAGTRYYIEQVERFFLHRLPGAKSAKFNIKIKNSNITDPGIRSIIEKNIIASLSKTTPVYTQLNQIIWQ